MRYLVRYLVRYLAKTLSEILSKILSKSQVVRNEKAPTSFDVRAFV